MFSESFLAGVMATTIALALSGCSSEFCTRHSDCGPGASCGETGLCSSAVDASEAQSEDAGELLDENRADASLEERGDPPDREIEAVGPAIRYRASEKLDITVWLEAGGLSP